MKKLVKTKASSGSVPYKAYSGHSYTINLYGYAYMISTPVASIYGNARWTR